MEWKDIYKSRLCSADEALKAVENGFRVMLPFAVGQPEITLRALADRAEELETLTIAQLVIITPEVLYLRESLKDKVRFMTSYVGRASRKVINEGNGVFVPVNLHCFPVMWAEIYQPDVVLIQTSPPDKHGYCSLGTNIDHIKASAKQAKIVITEVNENMPRTHGDSFIHVSEITYFVEHSHPLLEIPRPKITDVERSIGQNCASLIEDGSTLQLGIGAIPDAVLQFLKDKKDLGLHTEMFSDGAVELMEMGVINNRRKTLNPGKNVAAFLMGSKKLYTFVDDNPNVWMFPADYTNNPYIIAQNEKMVSINSSVAVDLMGQAASESIGTIQISGVGGQVDFVRGATAAKDGKAILAFPSTTDDGKLSKIVPQLEKGTPITVTRNDIDYVVTEYGVAKLRYKGLRERANALINIAHPNFRSMLRDELKKLNF